MRRLSAGIGALAGEVRQKLMAGSVSAILIAALSAFGLFWFGLALHWLLVPAVGMFWAWLIPAVFYFMLAGGIAVSVFGTAQETQEPGDRPAAGVHSLPLLAEQLGMELGRGLEREVHRHPLRAVSLAALGGAILGASPELRRSLLDLITPPSEGAGEDRFHPYDPENPENRRGRR